MCSANENRAPPSFVLMRCSIDVPRTIFSTDQSMDHWCRTRPAMVDLPSALRFNTNVVGSFFQHDFALGLALNRSRHKYSPNFPRWTSASSKLPEAPQKHARKCKLETNPGALDTKCDSVHATLMVLQTPPTLGQMSRSQKRKWSLKEKDIPAKSPRTSPFLMRRLPS